MQTIAEALKEYIDNNGAISGPGGSFSGDDYSAIAKVLDGTADNFVIFDNCGGKRFTVWLLERMSKGTSDDFNKFVKSIMGYVYMYKINGSETIVKKIQ